MSRGNKKKTIGHKNKKNNKKDHYKKKHTQETHATRSPRNGLFWGARLLPGQEAHAKEEVAAQQLLDLLGPATGTRRRRWFVFCLAVAGVWGLGGWVGCFFVAVLKGAVDCFDGVCVF